MRPHRLRVTAFGAFAGTEEVDFAELDGLFLLHGETGAGKTTLLDAIAFALYGRVPGVRGKAKRLRSDHAAPGTRTEVMLEATVGGRRLRVTRRPEQQRPKRSGTGTSKEHASVILQERGADGGWEAKSTRVGEADAEILDLMGMSADQFFQVVLLPQGEFARFLHADAGTRAELLQKLFGTDRFRAVEDWLAERRRATSAEVIAASAEVDRLLARISQVAAAPVPDDGCDPRAWLAGLSSEAEARALAAAGVAAGRKADLDAALAARTEAERLADRQRRRRDALARRTELEAAAGDIAGLRAEADAAARAAEVAPVLEAADRAALEAEEARDAEERARALIPAEWEALRTSGAAELLAAKEEQRERQGRLDALRAIDRRAEDEEKAAHTARRRAAGLDTQLAALATEAADRKAARLEAAQARDAASRAAEALPGVAASAASAAAVAADAAALAGERARRRRLREAHLTRRETALALREEAGRLREARIDGMRAELAASLVGGTPCPVCGSLDHPDPVEPTFEPVGREREERAYAAADEASGAADEAGRDVAAADAKITDLTRRLTEAGWALPENAGASGKTGALERTGASEKTGAPEDTAASEDTAMPENAGVPEDPMPEDPAALAAAVGEAAADAARLDGEAAALRATAATLPDRQRVLDDLDSAIADAERTRAELGEQRTAALAEAEGAAGRAAEARETLAWQLDGASDLEEALGTARELAGTFGQAVNAIERTERAAATARDERERAVAAAADAGFGDPPAGLARQGASAEPGDASGQSAVDTAQIDAARIDAARINAVREAFRDAGWRSGADQRIRRHEADVKSVASLLADPDLDVPLEPEAPVASRAEAAREAQRAHEEAVDAHGRAGHTAEQLRQLRPRLTGALGALRPLRERADQVRQLADVAAGLGGNQYKMTLSSFVLAGRLEEVAAEASRRLATMTGGRYTLVHTDTRKGGGKAGLGLLACDAWTGQDRDTSTLSGGETFLASLALALGLADVVTHESAGTPMEALFVDEGFGTLDEDTLEEVMTVLDGLRAGGRTIGIVSHVTELRQRIPSQIHVRKGSHGSHISTIVG